jgi:hypothetical protein
MGILYRHPIAGWTIPGFSLMNPMRLTNIMPHWALNSRCTIIGGPRGELGGPIHRGCGSVYNARPEGNAMTIPG